MKKFVSILILFMVFSCNSTLPFSADNAPADHHEKPSKNLVGTIDKASLLEVPHQSWYEKSYSSYTPNENNLEALSNSLNDIQIKAFMGTWCHDSKREVPRLYKILENANYNFDNLSLIALNYSKSTPEGLEKGLDIRRTPTFIISKDNKEIGRIVETPRESLEKDLLKIINGVEYKHSYQ